MPNGNSYDYLQVQADYNLKGRWVHPTRNSRLVRLFQRRLIVPS